MYFLAHFCISEKLVLEINKKNVVRNRKKWL